MSLGSAPITRERVLLELPEASTAMDISTDALSDGKMLSNGIMEFYGASENEGDFIEIESFVFREHHENVTPDLQKIDCRVYFFKDQVSIANLSGADIDFTLAQENAIAGFIDIATADWKDVEGGKGAFCRKDVNLVIKLPEDLSLIQSIAVCKGAADYTADHTLIPEIIIAR